MNDSGAKIGVYLPDEELKAVKLCCSSREWIEGILPLFSKLRAKAIDKLEEGSDTDDQIRGELALLRRLAGLAEAARICR